MFNIDLPKTRIAKKQAEKQVLSLKQISVEKILKTRDNLSEIDYKFLLNVFSLKVLDETNGVQTVCLSKNED